jgi:hypothetical protein
MKEKSLIQKDLEMRLVQIKVMPLFGLAVLEFIGIVLFIMLFRLGPVCLIAIFPMAIGLLIIPIRQYGIKKIAQSLNELNKLLEDHDR